MPLEFPARYTTTAASQTATLRVTNLLSTTSLLTALLLPLYRYPANCMLYRLASSYNHHPTNCSFQANLNIL